MESAKKKQATLETVWTVYLELDVSVRAEFPQDAIGPDAFPAVLRHEFSRVARHIAPHPESGEKRKEHEIECG